MLARYGHLEEALPVQLDLVAVVDNDWDREAALTEVGVTYHLLGDLAQAERYYREALGDTNDKWANQLVLMSNLGEVMLDAGRLDEAAAQPGRPSSVRTDAPPSAPGRSDCWW